jgi:hypothetical protein
MREDAYQAEADAQSVVTGSFGVIPVPDLSAAEELEETAAEAEAEDDERK